MVKLTLNNRSKMKASLVDWIQRRNKSTLAAVVDLDFVREEKKFWEFLIDSLSDYSSVDLI
ncbi:hypothetical protein AtEden1_Chr2g0228861 [Arabidopsis thaliana]